MAEPMARLFLQTLYSYRRQGKFRLHAFVLMPEHFHLLLTPSRIALERAMQLVKGGFSHDVRERLGNTMEIWERGFTDQRIRDADDFIHHRMYIHQNPVERQLVAEPSEFRYCSAFPGFKLDPCPQRLKPNFFLRLDGTTGTGCGRTRRGDQKHASGAKARTHFQRANGTSKLVPFPKPARIRIFPQPLEVVPFPS